MVCNYDNSPNRDRHSLSQVVLGGCGGKRWYVVRTKPGYGVAWVCDAGGGWIAPPTVLHGIA